MKTIAFVPMKLKNERLPGKNTKPFTHGKPLCKYILETLKKVKEIDEIYVYCSDPAILLYLPKGIKFLKRDPALDGSQVKIMRYCGHLQKMCRLISMSLLMPRRLLSRRKRFPEACRRYNLVSTTPLSLYFVSRISSGWMENHGIMIRKKFQEPRILSLCTGKLPDFIFMRAG